jgi:AraC family transcriptional regulator
MEPILGPGHFFGQKHRSLEIPGARFTEMLYSPAFVIPRHAHECAFFGLVLEGAYTEVYERRCRECQSSSLLFHPEGEVHSESHYDVVVRIFSIEPDPRRIAQVREHSGGLKQPLQHQGGPMIQLAMQLYDEFRNRDGLTPLALEGLMLELLAAGGRHPSASDEQQPTRWLQRARDLLQDRFAENLSLQEIALAVGVHPAHLARAFRQQFGCTVGEYVRTLRMERARRQLAGATIPICDIALELGYSDQSHFTTAFKRHTGLTPTRYRKLCR